ncbi:MAG: hypothetical protein ACP5O8_01165 [Candidatus Aenigmatarchaeota archaeon]
MICPRCSNETRELVACDRCKEIGCVRCIVKKGKEWLCDRCRKEEKQEPESVLASLFG